MKQFNKDELLHGFKSGDIKAFDQVYYRYYEPLFCHSFSFVRDQMVAEEIANDALMKTWKNREKITDYACLEGFLFNNARLLSYNYLRWRKVRKVKFVDVLPDEWTNSMISNPIAYNNILEAIDEVLAGLNPEYQLIAKCWLFEELALNEIARRVNKAEQTVRNIKGEIWKMLKEAVKRMDLPLLVLLMKLVLQYTI